MAWWMQLVTGAGGFIGGHLVRDLLDQGRTVRAVDIKPFSDWYQIRSEADNQQLDLSDLEACRAAVKGARWVYNLAADMGGMGFIENNKALCMLTVLESTHMLVAARDEQVERFFYSSSACVYAADKQTDTNVTALKESDAYPAMAEDGYGWRNFSPNACADISQKILNWRHESRDITMCTVRTAHTRVVGKRPPQRSAAKLPMQS